MRAYVEDIEGVVLAALRANLADTLLMNAFLDVYIAERNRLIGEAVSQHDTLSKRLAQIENQSKRLLDAYKAEIIDLQEFDAERAPLKARRMRSPQSLPSPMKLPLKSASIPPL